MRRLKTWAWVLGFAALSASPATAQQGGIMSGGQPSGVGLGQGASALGNSSGGLGSNSSNPLGSSSGSGLGSTSGSSGSSSSSTNITAPTIAAPTGTASSSLDKSNFLGGYYANPYYQGIATTNNSGAPGGFGSPLYGTTSSSGSGRGGINTGTSGLGGTNSNSQNSNTSGIVIPIQVQINYAATMRFPTPPVATPRLQNEIRVAIDNTSLIADSKNVQVITDANNNVTLRGTVKDGDEARLIEGMIRLTPGVHGINNQLTFPGR